MPRRERPVAGFKRFERGRIASQMVIRQLGAIALGWQQLAHFNRRRQTNGAHAGNWANATDIGALGGAILVIAVVLLIVGVVRWA